MKSVSSAHFAEGETEAHTQGHTARRAELGFALPSSSSHPFALSLLGTLSHPHHYGQNKTCSAHLALIPPCTSPEPFPVVHPHSL